MGERLAVKRLGADSSSGLCSRTAWDSPAEPHELYQHPERKFQQQTLLYASKQKSIQKTDTRESQLRTYSNSPFQYLHTAWKCTNRSIQTQRQCITLCSKALRRAVVQFPGWGSADGCDHDVVQELINDIIQLRSHESNKTVMTCNDIWRWVSPLSEPTQQQEIITPLGAQIRRGNNQPHTVWKGL